MTRRSKTNRLDEIKAANAKILAAGKCPRCGSKLKRNLAITGWWQCAQFGAEGFRARKHEPSCNFQAFV